MKSTIITIGLEIHIQLLTKTKLFSSSFNNILLFPNRNLSVTDLGMPGTLPVLNEEAVKKAIILGHILSCNIRNRSLFCRKHYIYPDLPKGYQITQYQNPLCQNGKLEIYINKKKMYIFIERMHLEEDAGKCLHMVKGKSYIDLNRAGIALLEIVTTPCIDSGETAMQYVQQLRILCSYLGICDGNMQNGVLRIDANVSVRERIQDSLGIRVELKNLNSIRFLGLAINYEIKRQIKQRSNNKKIKQETRLWNEKTKKTEPMRDKENENEYRYIQDPDLLPLILNNRYIMKLKEKILELPRIKINKYLDFYKLRMDESNLLLVSKKLTEYYEVIEKKVVYEWLISNIILGLKKEQVFDPINLLSIDNIIYLLIQLKEKKILKKDAIVVYKILKKNKKIAIQYLCNQYKKITEFDQNWMEKVILKVIKNYKNCIFF